MGKTISIQTLLQKSYPIVGLGEKWRKIVGDTEKGFKAIIWGASGSGKTTFALRFAKELTKHGKVYYNSTEQGEGKGLQDAARLTGCDTIRPGSLMLGDRDTFAEMYDKLKNNGAHFVFIDSVQYMRLTTGQYKKLIKDYPRKSFILISWEQNGEPKDQAAKDIRYMVDVKMRVHNGKTNVQSRFGPTLPFDIFRDRLTAGRAQNLLF